MSRQVGIVFVCWGNICRSPMAERVARGWAERDRIAGLSVTSAAVSTEESGNPIDRRAARVLRQAGYDADGHRAHRITASEIQRADLVIGMEEIHLSRMRVLVPGAPNLHLLTDFDPDAVRGSGVDDPWYGPPEGFADTLAAIESAMPGVFEHVRTLQQGALRKG